MEGEINLESLSKIPHRPWKRETKCNGNQINNVGPNGCMQVTTNPSKKTPIQRLIL